MRDKKEIIRTIRYLKERGHKDDWLIIDALEWVLYNE